MGLLLRIEQTELASVYQCPLEPVLGMPLLTRRAVCSHVRVLFKLWSFDFDISTGVLTFIDKQ